MIYAIGYRERTNEGGHQFTIQKHISKTEYEHHLTNLAEASKINTMANVFNLLKGNGKNFLNYTALIKEDKDLATNKKEKYLEANRLLINYLSSLSMFIDYGERHNKKHFGKERMQEFRKKDSKFYDGHISYRFIKLMRDYAVHYDFPLSVIRESIPGPSGIFASKKTLLKFSGWKHAKADIEKMPEQIFIDPHVEISMMFIKNLYEDYIYEIAPVVLKGIEYANNMIKDSGGKLPIMATFKNIDEFKKGNISIKLIETKTYMDALEIIKSHPSINIVRK
ncbi:hypothetical protein [Peribacillus butanolivorans]